MLLYKQYYRTAERNKYLKKLDKKFGLRSLDVFLDEEETIVGLMEINEEDIAERIVDKLMIEKLKNILTKLSQTDYSLIKALYIDGLSEREYAEKIGIYHNAVA